MEFQRATRKQAKLKLALIGPSGSGKTYSALRLAKGIGNKVAVIDTERGSASLYAHEFKFEVCELNNFEPESYIEALQSTMSEGYDRVVIDSLSHEWTAVRDDASKVADSTKNEWAARRKATPRHQALIDAIVQAPVRVIATMRAKTEWGTEKDEKTGKVKPVKLGLGPDQRQGIEYEFTTIFNSNDAHIAEVEKDRTGLFQTYADVLTEEVGRKYRDWLEGGVENPTVERVSETKLKLVHELLSELEMKLEDQIVQGRMKEITGKESVELSTEADADQVVHVLLQ